MNWCLRRGHVPSMAKSRCWWTGVTCIVCRVQMPSTLTVLFRPQNSLKSNLIFQRTQQIHLPERSRLDSPKCRSIKNGRHAFESFFQREDELLWDWKPIHIVFHDAATRSSSPSLVQHLLEDSSKAPCDLRSNIWHFQCVHSISENPLVHCKLPIITIRKHSATTTLAAPYLYAWLLLNELNSATHVLIVVKQPQNPSMIPWSTWHPTTPPRGTCCKS